jgi:hypothetical protein
LLGIEPRIADRVVAIVQVFFADGARTHAAYPEPVALQSLD